MSRAQVAIVGSGPSGCYAAQAISRRRPSAEVTVIDRLPMPFGLIRYGVAADHQGAKAITAQFDRLFSAASVRFAGGIHVGHDVSTEQLLEAFDAVVWAGGLTEDRRLDIEGEDLPGVYHAGEVTRAWNGHPLQDWGHIRIQGRVVVIGAGNVSLDLVRLMAKRSEDLVGTDLDDVFHHTLPNGVGDIEVVSRRGPDETRWDTAMIREICALPNVDIVLGPLDRELVQGAAQGGNSSASLLLARTEEPGRGGSTAVRFTFDAEPLCISGDERVQGLTVGRTGRKEALLADTVICAVGFAGASPARDDPRFFLTGWANTGARGTIPSLRTIAKDLASEVDAILPAASDKRGPEAILRLADKSVDFSEWKHLDAHELASAPPGRCRRKVRELSQVDHLLLRLRKAAR
ncbi:FAD-dependent oxidoreductase [Nocardioides sp. NPDC127503]|uniref:FAD-dependent oxidoreductase n=1 Tax=Nocardioides sp. NPDC127503 TaxID=3154516 RepID=UPI0033166AEB